MEEPIGAQYAVQIAFNTLKCRCRSLQQRVAELEEENLQLRVQCSHNKSAANSEQSDDNNSKEKIAELTQQKEQLVNKIKMVTAENQKLWTKLSKLNKVNEKLGSQLNQINDSLVQYSSGNKEGHTPLIRSKTFTQDEPQTKVLQKNLEENGKICSELEEISLKIINSFAQGKMELESLYSEITDSYYNDTVITDSCSFYYDEFDDNFMQEFESVVQELKATKEVCLRQNKMLQTALDTICEFKESSKKIICDYKVPKPVDKTDKSTNTHDIDNSNASVSHPDSNSIKCNSISSEINQSQVDNEAVEMICPVCCKNFFGNTNFQEFQVHVERHFTESEPFEVI